MEAGDWVRWDTYRSSFTLAAPLLLEALPGAVWRTEKTPLVTPVHQNRQLSRFYLHTDRCDGEERKVCVCVREREREGGKEGGDK